MGDLSHMTLPQLWAMTKAEIITAILGDVEDRYITRDERTPSGDYLDRVEIMRSRLTGEKLRGRRVRWSYYPSGSVRRIIIIERDADDIELRRRTVLHYEDGRQPEIEEIL